MEVGGRRTLYLSDLEVDRGRSQGSVDEVVRIKEVADAAKENGGLPATGHARVGALVSHIAKERGIEGFHVPADFPVALADALRAHGFGLRWSAAPFVPERACKAPEEVEHIRCAVRHTEAAMQAAIDRIAAAEIRDGMLYENGEPLTSEAVRLGIDTLFLERQCDGYASIVAGGDQGVDPHERGHGPLPANLPILLDIFPRDLKTRYHGDMTRTVVRGKASDDARRMFESVKKAKAAAEAELRDGADAHDVHAAVNRAFEEDGFETGMRDGRMVGFFHGTGHGLGLDVHEYPRLGDAHIPLCEGHVVTIEPGLYYPGIGGMRIEDDLLVTKDGCENLCELEVVLEI